LDPAFILALVAAVAIFLMAAVYSHVGHSGAAGYLAILFLLASQLPPIFIKPTALFLAIPVALVATIRSFRSGVFSWRTFWPFAVGSAPVALITAALSVNFPYYLVIVAPVLIYAALRLFLGFGTLNEKKPTVVPIWIAVPAGAVIGLVAGLAGVGGAIFIVPLLLLMRWAKTNEAIAVAAPFALLNLVVAFFMSNPMYPFMVGDLIYWVPAALIGAWIGTEVEIQPVLIVQINRILALVLLAGALRLIPAII
jgi:uncharacterized membrane protein YfcA